jgi:hypothetical protein
MNAQLTNAAPIMLAALQEFQQVSKDFCGWHEKYQPAVETARAAILTAYTDLDAAAPEMLLALQAFESGGNFEKWHSIYKKAAELARAAIAKATGKEI